jgi:murein DD-endopeptidase MepM/ murein hydrolase activator NlpD
MDHSDSLLYRLRIFAIGLVMVAGLVVLSMVFTSFTTGNVEASRMQSASSSPVSGLAGSPNLIADGFANATDSISASLASFNRGLHVFGDNLDHSASQMTESITIGTIGALRTTGRGFSTAGLATGNAIVFILRVPENTLSYIGDTRLVSAVIRPAAADNEAVPIIDPNSPELYKAKSALATADNTTATTNTASIWPLHGAVTTEFGASDWPYQTVHTGIDISDGQWAGTTPIHPFRAGKVVEVIHSYVGLGNHVVVDNGNGVTSVYGHMSATAVQVGQVVDKDTVLGFEGTTGASTGTHLHFEIRVNGQAANPHQFITGQP